MRLPIRQGKIMKSRSINTTILITLLFFLCFCLFIFSLTRGYYALSFIDALKALFFLPTDDIQASNIIHNIRLPRALAAVIIGSSLAVSGSSYQGMFKNPLVSPDILGVSSGASVGAAIAILFGQNLIITQVLAFFFGIITAAMSYAISIRSSLSKTISLILAGTVIGTVCTSIVSMIKYISDPTDTLPEITFWLMGSLSKVSMNGILLSIVPIFVGMIILFLARWKLNILLLDDDEAQSLGLNAKKWKFIIIIAATLLTSASVCLGGIIGWVGLMIPHIARLMFGNNFEVLLPSSCVIGAFFLLFIDTIIRTVFQTEVPIGVFTSILGGPFFLFLIMKKPRSNKGFRI